RELVVVRSADHELHGLTAATAAAVVATIHERDHAHVGDLFPLLAENVDEILSADLALAPRLQRHVHDAGLIVPARHAHDAAHDRAVVEIRLERFLDLVRCDLQPPEARALRPLGPGVEFPADRLRRVL